MGLRSRTGLVHNTRLYIIFPKSYRLYLCNKHPKNQITLAKKIILCYNHAILPNKKASAKFTLLYVPKFILCVNTFEAVIIMHFLHLPFTLALFLLAQTRLSIYVVKPGLVHGNYRVEI
jgi:hypothetical protein